jgi:hypothetical protein
MDFVIWIGCFWRDGFASVGMEKQVSQGGLLLFMFPDGVLIFYGQLNGGRLLPAYGEDIFPS